MENNADNIANFYTIPDSSITKETSNDVFTIIRNSYKAYHSRNFMMAIDVLGGAQIRTLFPVALAVKILVACPKSVIVANNTDKPSGTL